MVEAGARIALGYLRNQHRLRDRRPPRRFVSRTVEFLTAGRSQRHLEAEMAGMSYRALIGAIVQCASARIDAS